MSAQNNILTSRAGRITVPSISTVLESVDSPRFVWDSPDEPTILAWGVAGSVIVDGPNRFSDVRNSAVSLLEGLDDDGPRIARPRFLGSFSFQPRSLDTGERSSPWCKFPDAQFVVPRYQITIHDGKAWLMITESSKGENATDIADRFCNERARIKSLSRRTPGPSSSLSWTAEFTPSLESWNRTIDDVTREISKTPLEKVVIAQQYQAMFDREISVPRLVAQLRDTYPDCIRFLIEPLGSTENIKDMPLGSFLGASPELLVRFRKNKIETTALAGTAPRGETESEDDELRTQLEKSNKNLHEHELVVDSIVSNLRSLSKSITTGARRVKRLSNIQHLETPIAAICKPDTHVIQLVEALHPTPAVGGLPIDTAMEQIDKHENFDRGWYAAPVGWFDAQGNGSFAVGIRSALIAGHEANLYAGVGVVDDSEPQDEWREVTLKNRSILRAIQPEAIQYCPY